MEIIKTEGLEKIYKIGDEEVRAVDKIDLTINKGEFISILGPSGSGKSTLLHLLSLLDSPTYGKIFLFGKEAGKMNNDEQTNFRRKKIGFIFQQFNLLNNLNVYENVAIPLMLDGVDEQHRKEKVIPLLARIGLTDRLVNYPNQISGGQMQRVAIARALILNPEIIFADEPTGNLDSKSGSDIIVLLKEMHKNGKTIIMITHDRDTAKNADRIIYLKDGKIEKIEVLL